MHITLRAGERIYINGAVLRFDRKVSIELMNDATFLLESHVMRVTDAITPLRQVYFLVQTMLIDPNDTSAADAMFKESLVRMAEVYTEKVVLEGLEKTAKLVSSFRYFDALKVLRGLFAQDDAILKGESKMALAS